MGFRLFKSDLLVQEEGRLCEQFWAGLSYLTCLSKEGYDRQDLSFKPTHHFFSLRLCYSFSFLCHFPSFSISPHPPLFLSLPTMALLGQACEKQTGKSETTVITAPRWYKLTSGIYARMLLQDSLILHSYSLISSYHINSSSMLIWFTGHHSALSSQPRGNQNKWDKAT